MTKKTKSLNEEQLYDMMWSNEWKIVEKTQKLLDFCKEFIEETDPNRKKLEEVQDLIDKRYNIIGAQMILSEVKN